MTVTPTPEQIEAAYDQAHRLYNDVTFVDGDKDILAIATVIATAHLESEAKGRERGLDEAAEVAENYASQEMIARDKRWAEGMATGGSWAQERSRGAEAVARRILALKEKPNE